MAYFKLKDLNDKIITIDLEEFIGWDKDKLLTELEKYPVISLKKIIFCLHKIMNVSQAIAKKMPSDLVDGVGDFILTKEEEDQKG